MEVAATEEGRRRTASGQAGVWIAIDADVENSKTTSTIGPLGVALDVFTIGWSRRKLTDGFVPERQARRSAAGVVDGLDATVDGLIAAMLLAGRWTKAEGGYQIHDYAEWQEMKEDVLAAIETNRVRGQAGGLRSGEVRRLRAQEEREELLRINGQFEAQGLAPPRTDRTGIASEGSNSTAPPSVPGAEIETTRSQAQESSGGRTTEAEKEKEKEIEKREENVEKEETLSLTLSLPKAKRTTTASVGEVFAIWVRSTGRRAGDTVLDDRREKAIRGALHDYPFEDVVDAIRGWEHIPFFAGSNDRHRPYNELHVLLKDGPRIEDLRDATRRVRAYETRRAVEAATTAGEAGGELAEVLPLPTEEQRQAAAAAREQIRKRFGSKPLGQALADAMRAAPPADLAALQDAAELAERDARSQARAAQRNRSGEPGKEAS